MGTRKVSGCTLTITSLSLQEVRALAENPGYRYTPACPATAAGHTIIMMAAISSRQVFQPAARADRFALSSYRFVVREPQRG